MVMVVMVVMSLLVLRPRVIHVVDDQFGAVAHALHPRRRVHGILAPAAARVMVMVVMVWPRVFRRSGRLVQVLPSLSVVSVQSASALGLGRVQRGHRVRVRRRSVTVMFGTAIPVKTATELRSKCFCRTLTVNNILYAVPKNNSNYDYNIPCSLARRPITNNDECLKKNKKNSCEIK